MAKKKADAKGKGKEEGGGKKKMIIMVVVAAVLFVAGGKVMGGGSNAAAGVPVTTTVPEGPVKALSSITMNLADGRLLKVGVALQLRAPVAGAPAEVAAAVDKDDPTKGYARALDLVIEVLGKHTMAELVKPDMRDAAKKELVEKLKVAYHDQIEDIYFHEFVMQ